MINLQQSSYFLHSQQKNKEEIEISPIPIPFIFFLDAQPISVPIESLIYYQLTFQLNPWQFPALQSLSPNQFIIAQQILSKMQFYHSIEILILHPNVQQTQLIKQQLNTKQQINISYNNQTMLLLVQIDQLQVQQRVDIHYVPELILQIKLQNLQLTISSNHVSTTTDQSILFLVGLPQQGKTNFMIQKMLNDPRYRQLSHLYIIEQLKSINKSIVKQVASWIFNSLFDYLGYLNNSFIINETNLSSGGRIQKIKKIRDCYLRLGLEKQQRHLIKAVNVFSQEIKQEFQYLVNWYDLPQIQEGFDEVEFVGYNVEDARKIVEYYKQSTIDIEQFLKLRSKNEMIFS